MVYVGYYTPVAWHWLAIRRERIAPPEPSRCGSVGQVCVHRLSLFFPPNHQTGATLSLSLLISTLAFAASSEFSVPWAAIETTSLSPILRLYLSFALRLPTPIITPSRRRPYLIHFHYLFPTSLLVISIFGDCQLLICDLPVDYVDRRFDFTLHLILNVSSCGNHFRLDHGYRVNQTQVKSPIIYSLYFFLLKRPLLV